MWACLLLFGILTMTRNPEFEKVEQELDKQEDDLPDYKLSEALKSTLFWKLFLMMFNGVFFGYYVSSVFKDINLENSSDHFLTMVGAIASVVNGVMRIVQGQMVDKLGFKKVYALLLGIQLFVTLLMYRMRKNENFYAVCVSLSFMCWGGHFSLFPTACVDYFGIRNGGMIFTWMFFAVPCSSLVGLVVVMYWMTEIGISSIFMLGTVLTLLNVVLLTTLEEAKKHA